jgi:CHAT domain-containing protein
LVTQNIVEYDILERGTWRNLNRALLKEKYHVVHFIAHGAYINKEFCLIMDGDNINEWFITKDRFDQDLRSNPLQLFVLISCEGGTFNENLNTKGLGPILVEKGIPYLIAMQKPISFYAAEKFSKLFYENLIEYGSIDKAMAITRSDLKEDSQLKLAEWAIPVLFMATDEAELLKT